MFNEFVKSAHSNIFMLTSSKSDKTESKDT